MINQDELLSILKKKYSTNNEENYTDVTLHPTEGIVVGTDDPLQQGRLRVFCPAYGDNPEKIHLLPWSTYVSPFGGVINSSNYERNGEHTDGAVAYGMWAVPDLGASVVVNCFDGDMRRRFWSGCIINPQQAHTILGGRFEYGPEGKVEGPLSSSGNPIQPLYNNKLEAFDSQTSSPEYQTRVAGYTAAAVDKSVSQEPNPTDNIHLDQQYKDIAGAQKFDFNKTKVGGHGYDNSGFVNVPMKASRVFGFSSPGFHAITMDDRPFSNGTTWRSSSGHIIMMDDTNERIYIATNKGGNYVEMDGNGNIDVYSQRRISIHSDSDINLDAVGSIRMTAGTGIYGYAGGPSGLAALGTNPSPGEIRFQSQNDMHIIADNYRQLSFSNTIYEIGGDRCESVGGESSTQVEYDVNLTSNQGDFNTTVGSDYNLTVIKQMNVFATDGIKMGSRGDIELYSYYGNLLLGAQQNVQLKSVSGDIQMEAVGGNSGGDGGIKIKSNNSQISIDKTGTKISTNGDISIQSGGDMSMQTNSPVPQDQPFPDASQVPSDPTCGNLPPTIPIAGYSGADLAARVAWNAGFRGQGLTIAVAIAGAESSFNPNAIGDQSLQTAKWGPSCGFWQVRSLVNPSAYPSPDNLRIKDKLLTDAQFNANAAYAFSKSGTKFGAWSTYTNGAYLKASNMTPAVAAINRLCASVQGVSFAGPENMMSVSDITSTTPELYGAGLGKSSIMVSDSGIVLQSLQDVTINSLSKAFSTSVISGIVAQIDTISLELDTLAYYSSLAMAVISSITGHTINFPVNAQSIIDLVPIPSQFSALLPMISTGVNLNIDALKSNYFQYLKGEAQTVFNFENFDLNGRTII